MKDGKIDLNTGFPIFLSKFLSLNYKNPVIESSAQGYTFVNCILKPNTSSSDFFVDIYIAVRYSVFKLVISKCDITR